VGRRRKIVGRRRRCRKREKGKRRTVTGINSGAEGAAGDG